MLDRPFAGDDELEELVSGFEDGTLPKPRWTHRAHLAVGLVYCDRMPAPVALALLRERIRRYNVASGGENTSTSGYHETITRFYVYIVRRFIAEDGEEGTPAERANRLYCATATAICPGATTVRPGSSRRKPGPGGSIPTCGRSTERPHRHDGERSCRRSMVSLRRSEPS
jgi:hypothetical protein